MSDRSAGLYLHVPFCSRICPYCDFAVRTGDRARRKRFAIDLQREIALWADSPLRFDTIYFGGGTPSRLASEDLALIVAAIRRHLDVADDCGIYLEANPEDVTESTLSEWVDIGVTTLSVGIQSLDIDSLAFLGRRHSADGAQRAVELSLRAGFATVSIDLIYGLPGQSLSAWGHELEHAAALGAQHLSCYQLTIHARTRFGLLEKRGTLTQLPADEQAEMFRMTHRLLNEAGLQGYEVSQFALGDGHRSRHNLKYWDHTPYLGLGPSAHSFHDDRRWWNFPRTDPWEERIRAGEHPVEGSETLDTSALVLEALMTGMRTYAGVDLDRIRKRWGIDLSATNGELLQRLKANGLLTVTGSRVAPTLDGLAVADALTSRFRISAE